MFAVVRTNSVPDHLLGYLTRFLQQTGSGLYVGKLSPRVADQMWDRLIAAAGEGAVIMVCSARNDAGFTIRMHQVTGGRIVDFDGTDLPVEIHTSTLVQ
jgi:CRISPR-associated protein Cas2